MSKRWLAVEVANIIGAMNFAAVSKMSGIAVSRAFSRCGMVSQAIAYNMFLAFFPMLLMIVGLAASSAESNRDLLDLIRHLTAYLPPGSRQLATEYIIRRAPHAWRWTAFGFGGTLLAGSQVMKLIMDGIARIYGDRKSFSFARRQMQGLLLLCITILPFLATATLSVFGRPLRRWLLRGFGPGHQLHLLWNSLFVLAVMLLAMATLTVIYRLARPGAHPWRAVFPGALLATLLWWGVNALLGFYVRRVHYGAMYGGLAAVIGLLVWMYISAIVVFVGAAWNAQACPASNRA